MITDTTFDEDLDYMKDLVNQMFPLIKSMHPVIRREYCLDQLDRSAAGARRLKAAK